MIMPIAASVAANALTVSLPPEALVFRSATLSSGASTPVQTNTTISLTVPSGATLGTINGIASRLVVLAIYTGTVVELAIVNIAGGNQLDETNLISTTAISAASDSANVIYSTTARTSVPYRVMGFVDSTQATAGTWATAPSLVQGVGGQAAQHIGKILGSVAVTAAGTSVEFTGIPAWVKKITVTFSNVSTNGTGFYQCQVGAGTFVTTGYSSTANTFNTAPSTSVSTAGFILLSNGVNAAGLYHGQFQIVSQTNGVWVCSGAIGSNATGNGVSVFGGTVTLAAALDRVRFIGSNTGTPTDTFDNGTIGIIYE